MPAHFWAKKAPLVFLKHPVQDYIKVYIISSISVAALKRNLLAI